MVGQSVNDKQNNNKQKKAEKPRQSFRHVPASDGPVCCSSPAPVLIQSGSILSRLPWAVAPQSNSYGSRARTWSAGT